MLSPLTPTEITDTTTNHGLTRMGLCPTCRGHQRVHSDWTMGRHERGATRAEWLTGGRTVTVVPCEGGDVAHLTVDDVPIPV